eukprot:366167-Chlamydomonas_euryale.AAC.19
MLRRRSAQVRAGAARKAHERPGEDAGFQPFHRSGPIVPGSLRAAHTCSHAPGAPAAPPRAAAGRQHEGRADRADRRENRDAVRTEEGAGRSPPPGRRRAEPPCLLLPPPVAWAPTHAILD